MSHPLEGVRCDHGYGLLRDSCPVCDHMEETPHEAKMVKCKARWMTRATKRCSSCGKVGSHRIHVKLNA